MSTGFAYLKKKNGDLKLFGGSDEKNPEVIDIAFDDLLDFISSFVEELDYEGLERLEMIVSDRLDELADEVST